MISIDPVTAAVTLICTIALALVAYYQLRAMNQTNKAQFICHLETRWASDPTVTARHETDKIVEAITLKHKMPPSKQRSQAVVADFTKELSKLKSSDPIKYLQLMEICAFFEAIAYPTYVKYISIKDVYEILGGSILRYGELFEAHLEDLRNEPPKDKKLYEHFSWLLEEAKKMHSSPED